MRETWRTSATNFRFSFHPNAVLRALVRHLVWLGAALVAVCTFAVRAWGVGPAFDIFIDEVTYLRIVESVATLLRPMLYGESFYLHPPGYFFLAAGWWALFPPPTDTIGAIYNLRVFAALCSAFSAAALFLLAHRAGGRMAAVFAAVVFVVDPFISKMNSIVLLDTPALMWVSLGYLPLAYALPTAPASGLAWDVVRRKRPFGSLAADVTRIAWWRVAVAGIAFGCALLTKDMTAFLTLLPIALIFIMGWIIPRRQAFVLGVLTCLTYLPYPVAVAVSGDWQQFVDQKLRGLERLSGAVQETGFNRAHGPSLLETILARLDQFGTTYLLIAVGCVAVLVLLWRGGAFAFLVATWTGSAYILLGYCLVFGTLEEQFFYFLVVPVIVATAAALGSALPVGQRRTLGAIRWVVVGLWLVWGGYHWLDLRRNPSDGYAQMLAYVGTHAKPNQKIAAAPETGQFLLGNQASGPYGKWWSIDALEQYTPAFVLVDTKGVVWDGSEEGEALLQWLATNTTAVWSFQTDADRTLILYRMPQN